MSRRAWLAAVLLAGSAALPLGAQDAIAPVPRIVAYMRFADTPSLDPAGRKLMRGARIDSAADDIPQSEYPPELLAEPGKRDFELALVVSLDGAGSAERAGQSVSM